MSDSVNMGRKDMDMKRILEEFYRRYNLDYFMFRNGEIVFASLFGALLGLAGADAVIAVPLATLLAKDIADSGRRQLLKLLKEMEKKGSEQNVDGL